MILSLGILICAPTILELNVPEPVALIFITGGSSDSCSFGLDILANCDGTLCSPVLNSFLLSISVILPPGPSLRSLLLSNRLPPIAVSFCTSPVDVVVVFCGLG